LLRRYWFILWISGKAFTANSAVFVSTETNFVTGSRFYVGSLYVVCCGINSCPTIDAFMHLAFSVQNLTVQRVFLVWGNPAILSCMENAGRWNWNRN